MLYESACPPLRDSRTDFLAQKYTLHSNVVKYRSPCFVYVSANTNYIRLKMLNIKKTTIVQFGAAQDFRLTGGALSPAAGWVADTFFMGCGRGCGRGRT